MVSSDRYYKNHTGTVSVWGYPTLPISYNWTKIGTGTLTRGGGGGGLRVFPGSLLY
jgi:hypothetical protein